VSSGQGLNLEVADWPLFGLLKVQSSKKYLFTIRLKSHVSIMMASSDRNIKQLGQRSTDFKINSCHCYLEDVMVIRIISARKADKYEQKQYGSFIS